MSHTKNLKNSVRNAISDSGNEKNISLAKHRDKTCKNSQAFNNPVKKAKRRVSHSLVIKGTLVLTITGLATRFIGFYNRIFLSNLIGAKELGIYQLIFPLYMVAFSLTTMGNELALTKLVSEYEGRNDRKSAIGFFKTCFNINLILGIATALFFYFNADYLSVKVLNASSCSDCLRILSIGIPFMAMKGAVHGYFMGLERSEVHGTSDFLEQIVKIGGLYILSTYFISSETFTAAFAVIGIVLGEIVSFIYSLIRLIIEFHRYHVNSLNNISTTQFNVQKHNQNQKRRLHAGKDSGSVHKSFPINSDKILSVFIKNAIPLTTNRFALTVLQSAEAILIPTFLLQYYHDSETSLSIYGIFTGMAFPFIMFPATLTNSLSTMLLPAVSGARSELNSGYLSRLVERSIRFCLLIGIFSGITFFIFGKSMGSLFFNNEEAGIFLYQLSFLCPLIYLATTLASVLNGLGFATHNLCLTLLSTGIRLSFIIFAIPKIGISGYVIGLFASYLFLTFASLKKLNGLVLFELHFIRDIISPLIFFSTTGFLSYIIYDKADVPSTLKIPFLLLVLAFYGMVCFTAYLYPLAYSDTKK